MSILNEATSPSDLINQGLKCIHCHDRHVVYFISYPNPFFITGAYCYKCLLNHIKVTRRIRFNTIMPEYMIPTPMEWNLLARLKVDLGLETAAQNPAF